MHSGRGAIRYGSPAGQGVVETLPAVGVMNRPGHDRSRPHDLGRQLGNVQPERGVDGVALLVAGPVIGAPAEGRGLEQLDLHPAAVLEGPDLMRGAPDEGGLGRWRDAIALPDLREE